MMGLCVVVGAVVLTNYTRYTGLVGFLMNFVPLLIGAATAIGFEDSVTWPLTVFERTMVLSIIGMLPVSLLMLMLFPKSRRG